MDLSHLLLFAAAYLGVLMLPGPGVTALVARTLARGADGAPAFIAGIVAGALSWFTMAVAGLALLAATFAALFTAIRYAGAAYLLYLAWKLWTTPARPPQARAAAADGRASLFLTGLAINLGNPKAIVFFLALVPTVVDLGSLTPLAFAELAATIAVIASGVLAAYALAAAHARRLFASPRALRLLSRGSGAAMAAAALTIAAR